MMKQMHRDDNEARDQSFNPDGNEDTPRTLNEHEQPGFTITCQRCGGWTPVNEHEDEVKCARCGAIIGPASDIVVNFRPGMTTPVRWVGRMVLMVIALMATLAIWALLANRSS